MTHVRLRLEGLAFGSAIFLVLIGVLGLCLESARGFLVIGRDVVGLEDEPLLALGVLGVFAAIFSLAFFVRRLFDRSVRLSGSMRSRVIVSAQVGRTQLALWCAILAAILLSASLQAWRMSSWLSMIGGGGDGGGIRWLPLIFLPLAVLVLLFFRRAGVSIRRIADGSVTEP